MHRKVDHIGTEERNPEVDLADLVIQHLAGEFWIPVVDAAKDCQDWRNTHDHVEVRNYEIGIRQWNVDDHVA